MDVDHQMTNQWLKSGGLKSETEGFIIAAQDQAIKTNCYRSKMLNNGTEPMCSICGQFPETIDHRGRVPCAGQNLHRHDKAATYLHIPHLQRGKCKQKREMWGKKYRLFGYCIEDKQSELAINKTKRYQGYERTNSKQSIK